MTVGELLRRISSAEITEWQAFFALDADQDAPPARPPADPLEALRRVLDTDALANLRGISAARSGRR